MREKKSLCLRDQIFLYLQDNTNERENCTIQLIEKILTHSYI